MPRSKRAQRTLTIGLVLVARFLTVASLAHVHDEKLKDGQTPQGARDSAVDRTNAEGLAQLKGLGHYLKPRFLDTFAKATPNTVSVEVTLGN